MLQQRCSLQISVPAAHKNTTEARAHALVAVPRRCAPMLRSARLERFSSFPSRCGDAACLRCTAEDGAAFSARSMSRCRHGAPAQDQTAFAKLVRFTAWTILAWRLLSSVRAHQSTKEATTIMADTKVYTTAREAVPIPAEQRDTAPSSTAPCSVPVLRSIVAVKRSVKQLRQLTPVDLVGGREQEPARPHTTRKIGSGRGPRLVRRASPARCCVS